MEGVIIKDLLKVLNKVRLTEAELNDAVIDVDLGYFIDISNRKESIDDVELLDGLDNALDILRSKLHSAFKRRISNKGRREEEAPAEVSPPKVEDRILSIPEAASLLGCSRETVYKVHLPHGRLRTIKPTGKHQKVLYSDLLEYMNKIKQN